MFPDSKIAEKDRQSSTKIKYVMQHGIVPYIRDLLKTNFKNNPISFRFDETTRSQLKKQFDGHMRQWYVDKKEVVTCYCGSLFLGHCDSDQMLEHLSFQKHLDWSNKLPLHLGMDGPKEDLKSLIM